MLLQKTFLLPIILSFSFGLALLNKPKQINFIKEFLSGQYAPKSVLEHLCLSKGEKRVLQKALTQLGYRYISYSNSLLNVDLDKQPYFYVILASTECSFDSFIIAKNIATLLKYPNIWIVFGNMSQNKTARHNIPINSFFVIPNLNGDKNTTHVKAIYKMNKKDDQYIKESIKDLKNIKIVEKRKNFLGMPLRVTYVIQDKNTIKHFTDYRDKHIDNLTKINYLLYNILCDMLNCTQIRLFTNAWGFETKNKTTNRTTFSHGMFEDLMYGKSDVAGTVSFTPATRLKYFKYIFAPIKELSVNFIFRAPPLAYYTNLVVLPFDHLVWITIGTLLVLCSILINIIFHWEVKQKEIAKELKVYKENKPSSLDVVMMQIAVICQIDFFYEPRSISGKVATFTVLIFCTFIYTAFSAKIVLLLQSNTNKINNLNALYATNFEFGVENQLYNIFYFREPSDRADENWRKKIYENKIKKQTSENFLAAAEGMRLVRDYYFTFHIEQTVANHLIEKSFSNTQKCALKFIETIYKADIPYLAIPRDSPYIEFLIVSFRRLAETGVHTREYKNCFTKKPSCEGRTNSFVSVGLIESYFAFLVFGCGICISLIILVLENIVFRYSNM